MSWSVRNVDRNTDRFFKFHYNDVQFLVPITTSYPRLYPSRLTNEKLSLTLPVPFMQGICLYSVRAVQIRQINYFDESNCTLLVIDGIVPSNKKFVSGLWWVCGTHTVGKPNMKTTRCLRVVRFVTDLAKNIKPAAQCPYRGRYPT